MLQRRIISISVLAVVAATMVASAPLLLLIAVVLSPLPQCRSLPHALLFTLGFLYYECVGLLRLAWVWLVHRNHDDYLARNQHIQYWWAGGLLRLGIRIYALDVQITGTEARWRQRVSRLLAR